MYCSPSELKVVSCFQDGKKNYYSSSSTFFSDKSYLFMKRAKGELAYINLTGISESTTKFFAAQAVLVMQFFHENIGIACR